MWPQLLLAALGAVVAGAIQLPPYVTPCVYDDPHLNDCALKEARKVIKSVVNGDRTYNIPNLEPLIIKELKVNQDSGASAIGFSFVAHNCTLWGLSDVLIHAVRLDLKKQHIEYDLEFPRIEIKANYKANGKILLLPITGTGLANITITNAEATYRFNYTLEKRDDGQYMVITDNKLDYEVKGRAYIHLDNLFNGEKVLAENINVVLNENWQDVVRDVGPTMSEALAQLIKIVLGGMFGVVSMQNAFVNYPQP